MITIRQAQSTNAIAIYPNPANDRITISLSEAVTNATFKITNSLGNLIFKGTAYTGHTLNVDISALAAGPYFIQLDKGEKIIKAKFVKSGKL